MRAPKMALAGQSEVVIATVQSMRGKRLQSWHPQTFATIVIDEAHHSTAAGYRAVIDYFADAKVLGVTATPTVATRWPSDTYTGRSRCSPTASSRVSTAGTCPESGRCPSTCRRSTCRACA